MEDQVMAKDTLGRPVVNVDVSTDHQTGSTTTDVRVVRDGKERKYTGIGSSPAGSTREVVEKILGDSRTAEWLP
jgi:hypothetical protein